MTILLYMPYLVKVSTKGAEGVKITNDLTTWFMDDLCLLKVQEPCILGAALSGENRVENYSELSNCHGATPIYFAKKNPSAMPLHAVSAIRNAI